MSDERKAILIAGLGRYFKPTPDATAKFGANVNADEIKKKVAADREKATGACYDCVALELKYRECGRGCRGSREPAQRSEMVWVHDWVWGKRNA